MKTFNSKIGNLQLRIPLHRNEATKSETNYIRVARDYARRRNNRVCSALLATVFEILTMGLIWVGYFTFFQKHTNTIELRYFHTHTSKLYLGMLKKRCLCSLYFALSTFSFFKFLFRYLFSNQFALMLLHLAGERHRNTKPIVPQIYSLK